MTRCGFVALIGLPNTGKSTLVNALTGAKVSIVSPKVQTTRHRVMGVLLEGETQTILIDTPGIFEGQRRFDKAMMAGAWQACRDADAVVILVDATDPQLEAVQALAQKVPHCALVFNKVDAVAKDHLLPLAGIVGAWPGCQAVFMISAQTRDGIQRLKEHCHTLMPQGPWLFDAETITDQSQKLWAAEITREQVFLQLHQELPYDIWVETVQWEKHKQKGVRLHQAIYVQRSSQKKIVIGAKGQRLKYIGTAARQVMMQEWGHPVHLFLHVKIQENWLERPDVYRVTGLSYHI